MPPFIILMLFALLASLPARAAAQSDPVVASRAAYQEAVQAYKAHDFPAFLRHAREAERLRPAHGGVVYGLACAYALTGDTAAALATLQRFAALGHTADLDADADFTSLRSLPAFDSLRQAMRPTRRLSSARRRHSLWRSGTFLPRASRPRDDTACN